MIAALRRCRAWLALLAVLAVFPAAEAAAAPAEIRLDYAYYAPTSLALRKFGWLEKSLDGSGTRVRWVFSQGSNRSLEYLNAGRVDFASTAGLAAVLARANGSPVRTVYVASRPEWTALLVRKDSPIRSLAELKGRKVAATKGTDPYLFLLRSLHSVGLDKNDLRIVHLQHPDGRVALEKGQVDAWAGLDPHMAASELQAGSRLLYRNLGFNSYGVLNVREDFAERHPQLIRQVLAAYEQARHWVIGHPDEAAQLLAEEAGLPLEVARLQLSRTDFSQPLPGAWRAWALPLLALSSWEALVRLGWLPAYQMPAPSGILLTLVELARGELWGHVGASLARVAAGFAIGSGLALVVGTWVGLSRRAEAYLEPSFQALRAIPSLAWVPLLLLWFGIDETPKIVLIALGAFFPVYLALVAGVRGVDRKWVELGRLYRLSRFALVRRILLPAALPNLFTGLRGALSLSWMFLVAAELIAATQGLGYLLSDGRETSRPDLVIAAILVLAALGKLSDGLLRSLERRALRWRDSFDGEGGA